MHRYFLNSPRTLVPDALAGFARAHADLVRWNPHPSYVARTQPKRPGTVALIAGGGSGHEPAHTGFVGSGMLDAAVPGAVFASPSSAQIEAAGRDVSTGGGLLLLVKNYTGDVINFGIAADTMDDEDGSPVMPAVADDLATDGTDGPGRRGTGAVVPIEKICGAAAERGDDLDTVAALAERVGAASRSLAIALTAGTHPGQDVPAFTLDADRIEFGVGIHGERGIEQRPFGPASELAPMLVEPLVDALGLSRGDRVVALVNSLGATHLLELYTMFGEVAAGLDGLGIEIARSLVGPYVTSLDMSGCTLTLVRADDEMLHLWDRPVRTPALTW